MPIDATDSLYGEPVLPNATVLDFWRWGFGDLSDDDVKGFFAEWLGPKRLGGNSVRRVSWANSDVITPGKTRIEVKSAAYWQSWKYVGEDGLPLTQPTYSPKDDKSRIRFAGLKARDAVNIAKDGGIPSFKSDFYVFALQRETDLSKWNALDLTQWEFYWVPVCKLIEFGYASISLKTLQAHFDSLSANELAVVGRSAIAAFEASRNA